MKKATLERVRLTFDQWKQRVLQHYPKCEFTVEDGTGVTYGEPGDWTAHTGEDMQDDVVGVYVPGRRCDIWLAETCTEFDAAPILNYKKPFITPGTDWKVYSAGMRELLGMGRTEKLPEAGLPPRQVQGITVWVVPFVPKTGTKGWSNKIVRIKSSKHRVRALCPVCSKEFSAGRLFQHMPIHYDEA